MKIDKIAVAFVMVSIYFLPIAMPSNNVTVLITGFEPFGKWKINPSQMVAMELNGKQIENARIIGLVLPVDFNKSFNMIKESINIYKPRIIINLGLNGMADSIHVEKIAINLKCNEWRCSKIEDGNFIQFSPFPVIKIVGEMRKNGIVAMPSFFAGTYSCNYVFYSTLNYINKNKLQIKDDFIHLPPLSNQTKYGMKFDDMVEGIKIAIKISLAN